VKKIKKFGENVKRKFRKREMYGKSKPRRLNTKRNNMHLANLGSLIDKPI
jgi:hypothetical protein